VQKCEKELPQTSLYPPLLSTIVFLVQAQAATGAAADMTTELRANISKLNKLALNDQRALKRAVEFLDLREQAGFAGDGCGGSGGKRRDPLSPRQESNTQPKPVVGYSGRGAGPTTHGGDDESKLLGQQQQQGGGNGAVVEDEEEEEDEESFLAELERMEQAVAHDRGSEKKWDHGGDSKEEKDEEVYAGQDTIHGGGDFGANGFGGRANGESKVDSLQVLGGFEGHRGSQQSSTPRNAGRVRGDDKAENGGGGGMGGGEEGNENENEEEDDENAMDESTLTLMEQQLNAMPPMQWQGLDGRAEREADHEAGFIGPSSSSSGRGSRDSSSSSSSSGGGCLVSSPSIQGLGISPASSGRMSFRRRSSSDEGKKDDDDDDDDDGGGGISGGGSGLLGSHQHQEAKKNGEDRRSEGGGGGGAQQQQPSWFSSSLQAVAAAAAANEGGDDGMSSSNEIEAYPSYGAFVMSGNGGGGGGVGNGGESKEEREDAEDAAARAIAVVEKQRSALEGMRSWEQGVGERLEALASQLERSVKLCSSVSSAAVSLGTRHAPAFVALKERQLADDTEKLKTLIDELGVAFEGGHGWFMGVEWQQQQQQHEEEEDERLPPPPQDFDSASSNGAAGGVLRYEEKVRHAAGHRALLEAALYVCRETMGGGGGQQQQQAQAVDSKVLTAISGDVKKHLPKVKADLKRLRLYRRRRHRTSSSSVVAAGAGAGASVVAGSGGAAAASVVTLGASQQQQHKPQQQQAPQHLVALHKQQLQQLQQQQEASNLPALQAQAQRLQLEMQQRGDYEQLGLHSGAGGEYRSLLAQRRPEPKGWEAQPERETGKMVVLRKQDGLAVQARQPQGGSGGSGGKGKGCVVGGGKSSLVSRHCQHMPSDADLGALSLGVGQRQGGRRQQAPAAAASGRGGGRLYPHGEPVAMKQQQQQVASKGSSRRFGNGLGGGGGGVGGGGGGRGGGGLGGLSLTGAAVDFRLGVPGPASSSSSSSVAQENGQANGKGGGGGGRFLLDQSPGGGGGGGGNDSPTHDKKEQQQQEVKSTMPACTITLGDVVERYGDAATKFIQWYQSEEGKEPAPDLVLRILSQVA
jgi:hypothetical protein